MIDSRIKRAILSPEDVATQRQWRRGVCAVYAGIILILAAVWGEQQLVKPGSEVQFAGSPELAAAAEAARGEPAISRQ